MMLFICYLLLFYFSCSRVNSVTSVSGVQYNDSIHSALPQYSSTFLPPKSFRKPHDSLHLSKSITHPCKYPCNPHFRSAPCTVPHIPIAPPTVLYISTNHPSTQPSFPSLPPPPNWDSDDVSEMFRFCQFIEVQGPLFASFHSLFF